MILDVVQWTTGDGSGEIFISRVSFGIFLLDVSVDAVQSKYLPTSKVRTMNSNIGGRLPACLPACQVIVTIPPPACRSSEQPLQFFHPAGASAAMQRSGRLSGVDLGTPAAPEMTDRTNWEELEIFHVGNDR